MQLFRKIQNTLFIIIFSISSLTLVAGETDDAKSNLNKIQKQINSIDKQIKKNSKPVVFISGHFDNFELMAMCIEKSGINLAAIYRPLNNKYLNLIMEFIRKNYILKGYE